MTDLFGKNPLCYAEVENGGESKGRQGVKGITSLGLIYS